MFETLRILPFSFWVSLGLLFSGAIWAVTRLRDGSGLPTLALLGTVAAWYVGDALYNDYSGVYVVLFSPAVLADAWWQVALFLVVFFCAVPFLHRRINVRYARSGSGVIRALKTGLDQPQLQKQLSAMFAASSVLWGIMIVVALIRLKGEIVYYFFPFLGQIAWPWGRGRVGQGFDSLLALANYLDELLATIFGCVAATSTDRRVRLPALVVCFLTWPHFVFSRTRSAMLAVTIPGVISWVFLRLRGGFLKKCVVLVLFFLLVNGWMKFVIANRTGSTIAEAFGEKGFTLNDKGQVKNEGLNMYEELCWINTFFEQGTYKPNWGTRYFAEAVNFIPRALWPGKPMIGLDYAVARGHGTKQADDQGSVNTTISTGLIGQGVVNFGCILGPAAAAMLSALWVAVLARVDLQFEKRGRLVLYPLGLILTFNLGRDVTLLTLYPFIFGLMLVWWTDRRSPRLRQNGPPSQSKKPLSPVRSIKQSAFVRPGALRISPFTQR